MNYEEAKLHKQELNEKNILDSANLNAFEKSTMGLTPDHVRESKEWKQAKQDFERSFAELRYFNGQYIKTFKKEIQADRRKKRGVI